MCVQLQFSYDLCLCLLIGCCRNTRGVQSGLLVDAMPHFFLAASEDGSRHLEQSFEDSQSSLKVFDFLGKEIFQQSLCVRNSHCVHIPLR